MNEDIRSSNVRLVGADGGQRGIVSRDEALAEARASGLDLVMVAPDAEPPVCKIMDYGKFLYEKAKREREARKAQKTIEVKEIRLRPKTSEHHRSFKVRNARRWLEDGMKVKVRIRFRGREFHYPEIAHELLAGIAEELSDIGDVEQNPNMAEIIQVEVRQSSKFMKEYKNEKFVQYLDLIEEIVLEGQKNGVFKKEVIPGMAKRAFFGALDEMSRFWVLSTRKQYDIKTAAKQISDYFLNGIQG